MLNRKPVLVVLFLAVLVLLPWTAVSDFYTKGEPREAGAVLSILNDANWVIPRSYADEIGYKPPMMHWIIAGVSELTGGVREWTSRLPSAMGLIGLTMISLLFLLKRVRKEVAILTALILLTGFDMHRYALESRVDITLAFFMVAGLFGLYRWENNGLKGYPIVASILLTCATLVKGPVGFVLPGLVFGVYLLLRGHSLGKAIVKNVLIVLPSIFGLCLWYFFAWKVEGDYFIRVMYAENIGRVLGMDRDALGIKYQLGHTAPFWYYVPAFFVGGLPWTILLFPIGMSFKWKSWWHETVSTLRLSTLFKRIKELDAFTLFSWVAVLVIVLFYSTSTSKRSAYILPIYPFASFLMAKVFVWAFQRNPKLHSISTNVLLGISTLLLLLFALAFFVGFSTMTQGLGLDVKTLHDLSLFDEAFKNPSIWLFFGWFLLLTVVVMLIVQKRVLPFYGRPFGVFLLFISMQVFLESSVYPVFKNGYSSRPFAEQLRPKYDLQNKGYVLNDLRYYRNIYGLSFYLGNPFRNFEVEKPKSGFLVIGAKSLEAIRSKFANEYLFVELERSNPYNELNDEIVVAKIVAL